MVLEKKKNRKIEKLISIFFFKKFKCKDPLSGFKIYKKTTLKKININKINNFFLVDLVVFFFKKGFKIRNYNLVTNSRIDKPRIGNIFVSYFKMLKILIYLIKLNYAK